MRLRPEFVQRKLGLIAEELARLLSFRDVSHGDLVEDPIRLAAVERMLERIVVRAIDVNEHLLAALATGDEDRTTRLSYRDTFLRLADHGVYDEDFAERIASSAGLRNILVHEYNDVDHRIVHAAIPRTLEQYREYAEAVAAWLNGREGERG